MGLREEILSGRRCRDHEKLYDMYFSINKTLKRGVKVTVKEEALAQAKRYYGFFALMTNESMDALAALSIYRNKDVIEKAFGNLEERLNLRPTLVSSKKSLDGKLFVQFLALIYLSHIKKQIEEAGLLKSYTPQGLLDQLDVIECFEAPGHNSYFGEILMKQRDIYTALGVKPPAS
jgi:transposase